MDDREVGRPERLSNFTLPFGQVVAGLKFSEDGTSAAVVPSDGGVVRLYQIKPQLATLVTDCKIDKALVLSDKALEVPLIVFLVLRLMWMKLTYLGMCMTCAVDGPVELSRLSIIRGMDAGLAFALESVQCTYSQLILTVESQMRLVMNVNELVSTCTIISFGIDELMPLAAAFVD